MTPTSVPAGQRAGWEGASGSGARCALSLAGGGVGPRPLVPSVQNGVPLRRANYAAFRGGSGPIRGVRNRAILHGAGNA